MKKLVHLIGRAEAVLDHRHHHRAGEVLVDLRHVDVLRLDAGLGVETRRHRGEVRPREAGIGVAEHLEARARSLRRRQQERRLVTQVARPLRRRQHHRRRAVVLQAAVVEPERLGDPARGVIPLAGEWAAVHHRARIALRMRVGGERHRAQRLVGGAVVVEEALRAQRDLLRRRHQPERRDVGAASRDRRRSVGLTEPSELSLRERAVDHGVLAEAGGERRRRVGDRAADAAAAAAPEHVRERDVGQAERGAEAGRIAALAGVGAEAVDLAHVEPGVGGRLLDRLDREQELGHRRLAVAVVGGLADADDGDAARDGLGHQRVGPSPAAGPPPAAGSPPATALAARATGRRTVPPASSSFTSLSE